jgi:Zn-finger nucleic acid-binding protein
MPELATRLPCPACLGVTMEKVRIGRAGAVEVDHCPRCGGVWLEYGEVQGLRRLPPATFWQQIARRKAEHRMQCHDCHAPLDRNAESCPACGWKNILDCPACDRPMRRESREGLHLDACTSCKGVWFDHHELDAVWTLGAASAVASRPGAAEMVAGGAATAGDVLLDVLWYAPDLAFLGAHAAVHTAGAVAEVVSHLPEAAAAAPEAAIALVEAAGEASGSVFDVIAAIFEGIFGLFDN